MHHSNSNSVKASRRTIPAYLGLAAAIAVMVGLPSMSKADEGNRALNTYHSYHNTLAGLVIATPACATVVLDQETNKTALDLLDDALGVRTDGLAFWVYDGLRTWKVKHVPVFGGFDRYFVEGSDCVLYSNSVTARAIFDLYGLPKTEFYDAGLLSVPRNVD